MNIQACLLGDNPLAVRQYSKSPLAASLPLRVIPWVSVDTPTPFLSERAQRSFVETHQRGFRTTQYDVTLDDVNVFLTHITAMRMLLEDDNNAAYLIMTEDVDASWWKTDILSSFVSSGSGVFLLDTDKWQQSREGASFLGLRAYIVRKDAARKIVKLYEENRMTAPIDVFLSIAGFQGTVQIGHAVDPSKNPANMLQPWRP